MHLSLSHEVADIQTRFREPRSEPVEQRIEPSVVGKPGGSKRALKLAEEPQFGPSQFEASMGAVDSPSFIYVPTEQRACRYCRSGKRDEIGTQLRHGSDGSPP